MTETSKKADLKGYAALITATSSIVIAVWHATATPPELGAKATYTELSVAIKANSEQLARQHDDVVALRAYVAALNGVVLPPSEQPAPPPSLDAGAPLGKSMSENPIPTSTPTAYGFLASSSSSSIAVWVPPPVSPKPKVYVPPPAKVLNVTW
jgi:hypothetical protein